VLKAPFDGVLSDLSVEHGQYVPVNESVGLFLKLDPIKIKAEIPEKYVGRARLGSVAVVELSNGREVDAAIAYLAQSANQTTRTFAIELEALNKDGLIVEGQTAEIRLPLDSISATKITVSSCLTFGDDGQIGVKAVDARDMVRFYPIDIVREEPDGLWVSGLPETADVIVLGQEFVKIGEKVEPNFSVPGGNI
jgi:multidrug efflux system membrane fusion protein